MSAATGSDRLRREIDTSMEMLDAAILRAASTGRPKEALLIAAVRSGSRAIAGEVNACTPDTPQFPIRGQVSQTQRCQKMVVT